MTVDRELVSVRIAKIRDQLRHLSRLERLPRAEFLASSIEQHAVERELQIVIEACLGGTRARITGHGRRNFVSEAKAPPDVLAGVRGRLRASLEL